MFIVKSCPSCGQKLRFPIDKGKIKINCACGYSFLADPDDPSIYKKAKFDIKPETGGLLRKNWKKKVSEIDSEKIKSRIINDLLQFKYDLQNFKLLPSSRKKKIIAIIAAIILTSVVIGCLIYLFFPSGNVGENVI